MGASPVIFKEGAAFKSWPGGYSVTEAHYLFGALLLSASGFSAYVLFFRPDICGEANFLVTFFRLIFVPALALAGLSLIGSGRHAVFDAAGGRFRWRQRSFFMARSREGGFADIRRLLLDVRGEACRSNPESGSPRYQWRMKLSMDLGDMVLVICEWTRQLGARQRGNGPVDEAEARAAELAALIGCPLVVPASGD